MKLTAFLFTTAATLVLASVSSAQMSPTFKRAAMLVQSDIQKELKLDEKQKTDLKNAFGDAVQQNDDKGGIRIMLNQDTDINEIEKDAIKVLKPAQLKRLNEIWIQQDGFLALAAKDIREQLKLDKDSTEKINDAIREHNESMHEFFMSQGPVSDASDQEKVQKEIEKMKSKSNDSIKKLLTADQLKTWETMKGEEFKKKKKEAGG